MFYLIRLLFMYLTCDGNYTLIFQDLYCPKYSECFHHFLYSLTLCIDFFD